MLRCSWSYLAYLAWKLSVKLCLVVRIPLICRKVTKSKLWITMLPSVTRSFSWPALQLTSLIAYADLLSWLDYSQEDSTYNWQAFSAQLQSLALGKLLSSCWCPFSDGIPRESRAGIAQDCWQIREPGSQKCSSSWSSCGYYPVVPLFQ